MTIAISRAESFAAKLGLKLPILLAPMAGACPTTLSAAVANAGGMGACGAVLMDPDSILRWASEFRQQSEGMFQMNLWVPDPSPSRDTIAEQRQLEFLAQWGPAVSPAMGDSVLPDFDAQCRAVIAARPKIISSIMGLFPAPFVQEMKSSRILWFATATTVPEAQAAERAGADAVIAQGMEAGGHRGAFDPMCAEIEAVGSLALIPQVCDAVSVPVIAAGGIADARGVAAALILGASAVQIGTAFLRAPEAKLHPAYAERLGRTAAHDTRLTRAFSGRPGRSARTTYVEAAASPTAPPPAPYPVQRGFTRPMREEAVRSGDAERMQLWAGQSALLSQARPASQIVQNLWSETVQLFR